MQVLTTLKTRSQAQIATAMQKVQEQPDEVKTWGVTVGSAVVGAIAATTAANGLVAIVATLASPPVALTIGALGGGLLGWNYLRQQTGSTPAATEAEPQPIAAEATFEAAPPAAVALPEVEASLALEEAMPTLPAIDTEVEAATDTGAESFVADPVTLEPANDLSDETIASSDEAAPMATELEAAEDVESPPIAPEATPIAPAKD